MKRYPKSWALIALVAIVVAIPIAVLTSLQRQNLIQNAQTTISRAQATNSPIPESGSAPVQVIGSVSSVDTVSYVIYIDRGTIYAKNGKTGRIDFQGKDAAQIINKAMKNLTPGRTWQEKVVLKGNYILDKSTSEYSGASIIKIPSYTILDMYNAKITLADNTDKSIIANEHYASMGTYDYYITIQGGFLDGNGANQPGGYRGGNSNVLIGLSYSKNNIVRDVYGYRSKWEGIIISQEGQDTLIEGNTITEAGWPGIVTEGPVNNARIIGNTIYNSSSGIEIWNQDGWMVDSPHHLVIADNIAYNNTYAGILVMGRPGNPSKNIAITGNVTYGNDVGIWLTAINGGTITGNTAHNNKHDGIRVEEGGWTPEQSSQSNDNIISSNISLNNGAYGISIFSNHQLIQSRNSVIGNTVGYNGNHGIYLTYSNYDTISGNTCYDNSQAGASWNGIHLEYSHFNRITNNNCFDDQAVKTQLYGIVEYTGSDNNIITDNIVLNHKIGGIYINDKTNTSDNTKRNTGFVTENSGSAKNVADGGTIPHGLVSTPTKARLTGTVAGEIVTISSLNSTNIVVAIKKPDGTPGTPQTIYWEAEE